MSSWVSHFRTPPRGLDRPRPERRRAGREPGGDRRGSCTTSTPTRYCPSPTPPSTPSSTACRSTTWCGRWRCWPRSPGCCGRAASASAPSATACSRPRRCAAGCRSPSRTGRRWWRSTTGRSCSRAARLPRAGRRAAAGRTPVRPALGGVGVPGMTREEFWALVERSLRLAAALPAPRRGLLRRPVVLRPGERHVLALEQLLAGAAGRRGWSRSRTTSTPCAPPCSAGTCGAPGTSPAAAWATTPSPTSAPGSCRRGGRRTSGSPPTRTRWPTSPRPTSTTASATPRRGATPRSRSGTAGTTTTCRGRGFGEGGEPAGEAWDEDDAEGLAARYPRLAARWG